MEGIVLVFGVALAILLGYVVRLRGDLAECARASLELIDRQDARIDGLIVANRELWSVLIYQNRKLGIEMPFRFEPEGSLSQRREAN
jgi:hypothetical protein